MPQRAVEERLACAAALKDDALMMGSDYDVSTRNTYLLNGHVPLGVPLEGGERPMTIQTGHAQCHPIGIISPLASLDSRWPHFGLDNEVSLG